MTVDYSAKAATAARLLAKFGAPITLRRTTTTGGSPSTGGGTTTTTDTTLQAVILPIDGKALDTPGSLAEAGDFTAYVEAGVIDPQTTDRVICAEGTLAVIEAQRLAPAGVAVLWTLTLRKGA